VISIDNRGLDDSSIPANNDHAAETVADDVKGVLHFLNINETYVFGHNKGAGVAAALTAKYRSLVKRIGFAEYVLPGYGYETFSNPSPTWSLYSNWQLAILSIPDAAQFFIQGRESQMLSWYFFHGSYSGTTAIPESHLAQYTTQISKPGFLRSGLGYVKNAAVVADAAYIATVGQSKLSQPALVLGGEASLTPASLLQQYWGPIGSDLASELMPKAGHWIGK